MAGRQSVLVLDPPHELRFKGPFTNVVTADLLLKNPSSQRLCFKVKTTAPKQYCVRPNGGFVEPSQTVKVQVILQPFDYNPAEKNRHKFLVQSIVCLDNTDNQDQLWKDTPADQVMDAKLRCVFELPNDGQAMKSGGQTVIKREPGLTAGRDSSQSRIGDQSIYNSTSPRKLDSAPHKLPQVNILLAVLITLIAAVAGVAIGKFVL